MQSYLEHQGAKLVRRFDAGSYVTLTDALSSHDASAAAGVEVAAALSSCPVPVVVGGITSDRLYPLRLQQELADLLPGCTGLNVVVSPSTAMMDSWSRPTPWASWSAGQWISRVSEEHREGFRER